MVSEGARHGEDTAGATVVTSATEGGNKRRRKRDVLAGLVAALAFAPAAALAARTGGRAGGGSFRQHSKPPTHFSQPRQTMRFDRGGSSIEHHHHHNYFGGPGHSFFDLLAPRRSIYIGPVLTPFSMTGATVGVGMLLFFATAMAFMVQSGALTAGTKGGVRGAGTGRSTVATLKVGLLASAKTFQNELEALARRVDTSSNSGLSYLLQETCLALMRHPSYWTHASTTRWDGSLSGAETHFGSSSVMERAKLVEESFSNYDNRRSDTTTRRGHSNEMSEHISVTIMVAAEEEALRNFPSRPICSAAGLRSALQALAAVPKDQLHAVEIIWAPHSDSGSLSREELLMDHPELASI